MSNLRVPPEPRASTARVDGPRARPVVPGESRVLIVGDSHVEALGPELRGAARRNQVRVGHLFERGTRLSQWAPGGSQWSRLEAQLARRPSHVVIALGTNDGLNGASRESIERHASALVERIRAAGAEPVFSLPLRVDEAHEPAMQRVRQALIETLRRHDVAFVDPSRTAIPRYDHVHATPAGYRSWASQIWRALFIVVLTLAPTLARAELYTFTDDDGVVHFTNIPNDPRYRLVPDPGTSNTYELRSGGLPRLHRVQVTRFDAIIREAAQYYSLPHQLIKAVIAAESAFEPGAVSHVGAQGLMQLMPATAREVFVEDAFDPRANIFGGTRYLRYLANLFNGDIRLTIAAYNCGPHVIARTKAIPNIEETQTYVKRVMAFYEHYLRTWTD